MAKAKRTITYEITEKGDQYKIVDSVNAFTNFAGEVIIPPQYISKRIGDCKVHLNRSSKVWHSSLECSKMKDFPEKITVILGITLGARRCSWCCR